MYLSPDTCALLRLFPPTMPGDRERELEASLSGVLEQLVMTALHPRSLLSVIVQLLEEDGSVCFPPLTSSLLSAARNF